MTQYIEGSGDTIRAMDDAASRFEDDGHAHGASLRAFALKEF
jgi:hypothetical protein